MASFHASMPSRRHEEGHRSHTASVAKPPKKIPKLRASCRECASHKLKCSGDKPTCARCADRGFQCYYDFSRRSGRVSWQDRLRALEVAAMSTVPPECTSPPPPPLVSPVSTGHPPLPNPPAPSQCASRASPSWQASNLASDVGSSRSSSVSLAFSDASMISASLDFSPDGADFGYGLEPGHLGVDDTTDLRDTGYDYLSGLSTDDGTLGMATSPLSTTPPLSRASSDVYTAHIPCDYHTVPSSLDPFVDVGSIRLADDGHDDAGSYECFKVAFNCLQRLSLAASRRCVRGTHCGAQPEKMPCMEVVHENKQCLAMLERVLECAPTTNQDIYVIVTLAVLKIVDAYREAVHDNITGPSDVDLYIPTQDPTYCHVSLTHCPPPLQQIMGELHRAQSIVRRLSERLDVLNMQHTAALQGHVGPAQAGRPPLSSTTVDALHRDLRRYLDATSFATIHLLNQL